MRNRAGFSQYGDSGNRVMKKKEILKAAAYIFSKKGFHQARVDEIAKRAKVAKGTLYYNYASKSDLFAAAVTEGMEEIIERVERELDSDLPFIEHFRNLIELNVVLYLEYSDLSKIVFNELSSGIEKGVLADIEKVRNRCIEFFAGILKKGHERGYLKPVDFHLASVGLIGLLDSLCNYYLKHSDTVSREQLVEILFTMLSSGLIKQQA